MIGKYVLVLGLTIAAVGLLMMLGPKIPWLGRLPGDIAFETPRVRFYFPVVTCLLLTALLTLALRLFR
jgi:uncharacterized membrane protein YkgB